MFQGMHTVKQGTVGIGVAIAEFTKRGWVVAIPLIDAQSYDLIIDYGDGLKKVQVKTTGYKPEGCFSVQLKHVHHNKTQNVISNFDKSLVDFVFVLCKDGTSYLIPVNEIKQRTEMRLNKTYDQFILGSGVQGTNEF